MIQIINKIIYGNETIEDFEKNTKYPICSLILNKILNFYIIIKDYDGLIKYINKNDKKKYEKITNYYKYLYYAEKKDFSKRNLYYERLTNSEKIRIRISNSISGEAQIEIFEKELLQIINHKKKRKKYGNLIKELYMINASRGDKLSIINRRYQKGIDREIKKILKRKQVYINDLQYLNIILEISRMYFINNLEKETVFTNKQITGLEKIIKIIENNIDRYKKILPQSATIEYNDNICETLRILIAITSEEKKLKEYISKLEEVINKKNVSNYLKELISYKEKSKNEIINDNLVKIKKALENNTEENDTIDIWFHQCISQCFTIEEFRKLYKKIKSIQLSTKLSKEKKDIINENLKTISFWANTLKISDINNKMKARPFLSLLIKYEAKQITYTEFLEKLKSLRNIESHSIECWEKIEAVLEGNNIDWLAIILSKEAPKNISFKLKQYVFNLYIRIRKEEKTLNLTELEKVDKAYNIISKDYSLYIESILVHIEIYDQYDRDVQEKVSAILPSITNEKYEQEKIDYLLYVITITTVQKRKQVNLIFTEKLIKHIELTNPSNKYGLLYCLSVINNKLIEKYYDELINFAYSYYSNKKILTEQLMSLIYTVFNYQIRNHYKYLKGNIFHFKNNIYVLDEDYLEEHAEVYKKLNIKKISKEEFDNRNIPKDDYDNILDVLIARIVFANIEKFGLGKKISFPENVSAEELIKELEKAIGADEDNKIIKQIKNGEVIENSFWLNHYTTHKYIKDIVSNPEKIFINSRNDIILEEKIIIHYTTFILLAKLGIIEKLVEPGEVKNKYYILGDTKKDIFEKYEKNIINYEDIIEERVDYSKLLEFTYKVAQAFETQGRIINVSSANTLGIRNLDNINSQDKEMFKILGKDFKEYVIVTEDPYYFSNVFKTISYGTLSLIINMYQNKLLTKKELIEASDTLKLIGYNFCVEKALYMYLLEKNELERLIEYINEASLKN